MGSACRLLMQRNYWDFKCVCMCLGLIDKCKGSFLFCQVNRHSRVIAF